MALIPWPDIVPAQTRWRLISNTQVSVSPLNGTVQTQELPGARWAVQMSIAPKTGDAAGALRAFLARMRGQANRVELHPFDVPRPRGTAGGTPLVNGAGQTGAALITDGWTAGATFKAGDYLQVGTQLLMAAEDATANGSGEMTIAIEPPLRASPADNAPLVITKPKARFMLASSEQGWTQRPSVQGGVFEFELEFIEAFP